MEQSSAALITFIKRIEDVDALPLYTGLDHWATHGDAGVHALLLHIDLDHHEREW